MTQIANSNTLGISSASIKFLDTFQIVFLNAAQNTLLPEIYEVFGAEAAVKFLDIFAGTTVTVPSRKRFTDCVRDTDIYLALSQSDGKNDSIIMSLASKYDLERPSVLAIYRKIRKLMGKVGEDEPTDDE